MNLCVHITYRHLPPSESLSAAIRDEARRLLDRNDILGCHVIVEPKPHSPVQVRSCRVRIEVCLPGRTLVTERQPPSEDGREDVYVSVRHAFRLLGQQLRSILGLQPETRAPRDGE